MQSARESIEIELDRITTRTSSLNLDRLEKCSPIIHACAQQIVDLTFSRLRELPDIATPAITAQLVVVVRDYLTASEAKADPDRDELVAELLKNLRRDLP